MNEKIMFQDAMMESTIGGRGGNEHIFKRDSYKYLRFDLKYNMIFLSIGLISFFQTVLQIIFSINSNNFVYFAACFMFGPFQLLATLLLLLINCFSDVKTKFSLATWATRLLTLGFIPFVNTIALNSFYIVDCYSTDTVEHYGGGGDSGAGEQLPPPHHDFDSSAVKDYAATVASFDYCANLIYCVANLVLGLVCVFLNLFFCIPFNIN